MSTRVGYINDVTDFNINDMVQQTDCAIWGKFNGVVVGFTVNCVGEPILLVDVTVRKTDAIGSVDAFYTPVKFTNDEFWHRITPMHPKNAVHFHDINNLVMDS
jgi:hypothetical protein